VTVDLYLRGLAVGFAIAFALGPIGLLVIRRTVDRGWAYGFLSGVGVATADAMYGAIAAFGLTAVSEALVGIDRVLGVVGGAVLVVLAVRSLRSALRSTGEATARADPGRLRSPLAAWASMVALTATNPATILSFAALFASIGAGTGGPAGAMSVVLGVFTGSVAWWALLTGLIAGLRARLTPRVVRRLNIASAAVIGGFGVIAIVLGIAG
jgi:threonine/homoserine/homoserine lactone efflux protein